MKITINFGTPDEKQVMFTDKKSAWTSFWDMHSGGGQKLDWAKIYIEALQKEAESVFYARFGRNPNRVTCTCCGEDYSISTYETLAEASAYHRNCGYAYFDQEGNEVVPPNGWKRREQLGITGRYVERAETSQKRYPARAYLTLKEYLRDPLVKVIYAKEIKDDERHQDVPEEGFVWRG